MKKKIEKFFCDDCGKEISNRHPSIYIKYLEKDLDLCISCIQERINHSFSICESRMCKKCGGKGLIKDWHYHWGSISENEYNCETCKACKGRGVLPLT